jgi:phosphatidylinositol alpha-1,6-mannosyltransferase
MVFLEAAACGLPVVAGDSGGAPDAVVDGETGLVVDGKRVEPVARAVGDLLADRDRAARMGARGSDWVRRRWSWERSVATIQRLLADPGQT